MISTKRFNIKLRVGDTVLVRSGKYKGQSGKVTVVHPQLNKVTVEGVNIVKKHVKPNKKYPQGGIIELTKPIWASKVGIAHPSAKGKTSRIGYALDKAGKKTRIYRQAAGKEIK